MGFLLQRLPLLQSMGSRVPVASVLVALGLQSTGLIVVAVGPVALQHMGSLPGSGIEPVTSALAADSLLLSHLTQMNLKTQVAEKQLISDGNGPTHQHVPNHGPLDKWWTLHSEPWPCPFLTHTHQQFLLSVQRLCGYFVITWLLQALGFYSKLLPHSISLCSQGFLLQASLCHRHLLLSTVRQGERVHSDSSCPFLHRRRKRLLWERLS